MNQSVLFTKDYAIAGATVDWTLIPNSNKSNETSDLSHQSTRFVNELGGERLWANESVYITQFGINDIGNSIDKWSDIETSNVIGLYGNLLERVCVLNIGTTHKLIVES